ncbi:GntR family transcriptional regulator [Streptomyces sp. NEAU-Y11]|uniref:GntR family transcriptional regulator n=1 Tax=Streptomyces cucumeris TaxID=2962890 RepID=UPI0020C841A8|nr:GntR family transcriptional regulator [Streptomyces sp. NEAU-Y11]MCP9209683.1 GntR family transcriptional regulator [Streptomyces sp. NEAU-Y11]
MSKQIPKYRVIAQNYRTRVESGELEPGTVLESRRKLRDIHNTSRATIDKVIDLLTAEGILEPSDGNRPPVVANISHRVAMANSRVASAAANGRALAKHETSEILSVGMVPCPENVAKPLGVEPGQDVLCRVRLNLFNGAPVATGRSYYPPEVTLKTPELREPDSIPSGSRELAAERMGSKQADLFGEFTSRLATDEERELLKLGGSYNVVSQTIRRVLLANGKLVEVAVKVHSGDRPVAFHTPL